MTMTNKDAKPKLPPPPKTLSRADVLKRITANVETREVDGYGLVECHPMNLATMTHIREASRDEEGNVDAGAFDLHAIIATFPSLFTEDDFETLAAASVKQLAPFMRVVAAMVGRDDNGSDGRQPNRALTFREVSGAGGAVSGGE
jgi:hypothetical protein